MNNVRGTRGKRGLTARELLKKKALDRWENEGGSVFAGQARADERRARGGDQPPSPSDIPVCGEGALLISKSVRRGSVD